MSGNEKAQARARELGLRLNHVYTIEERYTVRPSVGGEAYGRRGPASSRIRTRSGMQFTGWALGELLFEKRLAAGSTRGAFIDPPDLISAREER